MSSREPVFRPVAADEDRHTPGPEELWGESWYLDWAAADCSYGGYVRLGLYPNLGKAWWGVALGGAGRPLGLTLQPDMPCPAGAGRPRVAVADTPPPTPW